MKSNLFIAAVLAAIFSCTTATFAQQDPLFSQQMLNSFVYNPAYAGLDDVLSVTAHFRAQWVGIDGHPVVENLSAHTPVQLLHGGAGIQILNEQEGVLRMTSATAAYSYIHKSRIGRFSLGVSGGIIQGSLDGNKLRAPDGDYENTVDHNDNILPVGTADGIAPDFSAGIFFSSTKVNLGLSSTHIIPVQIKLNNAAQNIEFDMERQYYFQAGFLGKLSKEISLRPSVYLRSNGNNLQADGDLIFSYNNLLWFGAGYRGYNNRTQDAVIGLIGLNVGENLRIGYSYDYTLSPLKVASDGSHEVVLNYRVNLVKPAKAGKVIYNPRF